MSLFQPAHRVDLVHRLQAMAMELPCFEHALARGVAEANSYSEGAPAYGPEMGRYMRTIETLHDGLIGLQRGWERSDPQNRPTWINPGLRLAVVVSSGDENTGQITAQAPSNRNPRGVSFGRFVEVNGQIPLFDAVTRTGDMIEITQTWVFLYHAMETQVFSELSLPTSMAGSRIIDWRERILFPRFDGGTDTFEAAVDDDPQQDFGFTIQRR